MSFLEILVVIICSLIVLSNIFVYIFKRIRHMPTGECSYCSKKENNLLKEYRKKYKKEKNVRTN